MGKTIHHHYVFWANQLKFAAKWSFCCLAMLQKDIHNDKSKDLL